MIIGANRDEGSYYMIQFLMHPAKFDLVENDFDRLGTLLLLGASGEKGDASKEEISIARDLLAAVTEDGKFSKDNWVDIRDLLGELLMLAGQELLVERLAQSDRAPVYFYNYRYCTKVLDSFM